MTTNHIFGISRLLMDYERPLTHSIVVGRDHGFNYPGDTFTHFSLMKTTHYSLEIVVRLGDLPEQLSDLPQSVA